jgi:hypothetical protein
MMLFLNKQLLKKRLTTANNKSFKTLRLALSCTGNMQPIMEGLNKALAAMNATLTRVNGIFNKDLAVKLILTNNDLIIYTNAVTDPYSDTAGAGGAWSQELQDNLTTVTKWGYDIGHLFGATGGGGNAGCIGCVCVNPTTANPIGKEVHIPLRRWHPQGDAFDIDFVVHEIGSISANHTFSYELEGTGVNVSRSGSTIICWYYV